MSSFRTFMYYELWPYILCPLDFQFQKRILSAKTIPRNTVSEKTQIFRTLESSCILSRRMVLCLPVDVCLHPAWVGHSYFRNAQVPALHCLVNNVKKVHLFNWFFFSNTSLYFAWQTSFKILRKQLLLVKASGIVFACRQVLHPAWASHSYFSNAQVVLALPT